MLKPIEMCRVTIAGSKRVLEPTIEALHELGLLHIVDYAGEEYFEIGEPLDRGTKISELLVKARSLSSHLGVKKVAAKHKKEVIREVEKKMSELESQVLGKMDELKRVDTKFNEISALRDNLEPFARLPVKLELYSGYESLAVFVGFVRRDFEDELKEITSRYELFRAEYDNKKLVALFVVKDKEEEARSLLANSGYTEINVPPLTGDVSTTLKNLGKEQVGLEKEKSRIQREFERLSEEWSSFLVASEDRLSVEMEKAEAPLRFATSENAFIIDGWVPLKEYEELEKKLNEEVKEKIYVKKHDEIDETVPIELDHSKPVKPFQFFMDLYTLPKYFELDPTIFFFITFPLFFGIMLGDIGYGLIILGGCYYLRNKFTSGFRALLNAFIPVSIATIVFGFIFGEFFGAEVILGYELPCIMHRATQVTDLLLISIIIGLIHVNLGLIIGFYNKLRMHGLSHAIMEKGSWLTLQSGAFLMIAQYMNYISFGFYAGLAIIMLSISLLVKGEGLKGAVEVPSLLANILSYTRLAAVGIASLTFAAIINEFAKGALHKGGIYILGALLILVTGHALNLALGIIAPFLQSIRLHYVEFFSKFFEGGGKRYKPFGHKKQVEV